MKFEARLLTVGKKPEVDWKGKNATLFVEFPAAENHNRNIGTKEEPEWETVDTSWFQLHAWGDVAQKILDLKVDQGDAIKVEGQHKIRRVQEENEKARYYNQYKITDIEKYPLD